ncbi:response regulator transcription factor [Candidatus Mycosynbacter amalyticus]|uniref:response regulator transcription factor n=1 Tax=Candidatus Mycosynbacter amalyticus TaxID=2665156 RepID=UPI0021B48162|nr:response regulator transcription factor [Candidatus Mycosynbacter amalyticus]
MQILLAEDNQKLARLTKQSLVEDGFVVDIAKDGNEAIDKFDINEYDLVILDVLMPEQSGFDVAKKIRKVDTTIPILMLTALGEIDDKVKGFYAGADDYLVKPFSFEELTLRVKSLIRRGKRADPIVLQAGKLTLDTNKQMASYDGRQLTLTAKELGLLNYLLVNKGRVVSKTELIEHVWDMNYDGLSNVVETYVRYLRKKLRQCGASGDFIKTMRNLGYIIEDLHVS